MKAYVIEKAGGPENLILRDIPTPKASADKILIKIKAFGLNRSEYFTRMGDSPNVRFPRVLSIEGTGNVAESEDGEFSKGDKVFAIMISPLLSNSQPIPGMQAILTVISLISM